MKVVMGLGRRLMIFITHCYYSQSYFSKLLEIPESTLSRYIHDKSLPAYPILYKFYELGLSIDWLFGGTGNMYADNDEGNKLMKQSLSKDKHIFNEFVTRLSCWIIDNYESIENFCLFNSIDKSYTDSILNKGAFPDSNFVELFENAGCNFRWAYTGIGSKFNTTPAGKILKCKSNGLLHLINHINIISLKKFDIKKISTKNEIFEFLKIAIAIESSNLTINENILVNINDNLN